MLFRSFGYAYLQGVKGEQFAKFRDTYNHILALHRQEQERKTTPETEKPAPENRESEKPAQQAEERPSEKEARQPAQTLEERLLVAKEQYGQRLSDMNADEQKKYRILEAGMENLILGLPEQTQMQARLNFYQAQYERMDVKNEPEQPPEQQELFYGR